MKAIPNGGSLCNKFALIQAVQPYPCFQQAHYYCSIMPVRLNLVDGRAHICSGLGGCKQIPRAEPGTEGMSVYSIWGMGERERKIELYQMQDRLTLLFFWFFVRAGIGIP